jgi:hypothetical protein
MAVAGGAVFIAPASAEAMCTDMSTTQSRPLVSSFLIRPAGMLERFPFGGSDLSDRLTIILTADIKGTLPSVLDMIRLSNHVQKEAIGASLGAAYSGCLKFGDSRAAELVQTAVARMTNSVVRSAFYSATAGYTDTGTKPMSPGGSAPDPEKGPRLPVGRLDNPFASAPRLDPLRPLGSPR